MLKRHIVLLFAILFLAAACPAETVNYTYDNAGRLVRVDYANGVSIAYIYDPAGNLLNRSVTNVPPAASDRSADTRSDAAAKQTSPATANRLRRFRRSAVVSRPDGRTSGNAGLTGSKH